MLVHFRAVFWEHSCSCCIPKTVSPPMAPMPLLRQPSWGWSTMRHHTERRSRCSWPGAVTITLSLTPWRPQKPSWSSGSWGPGCNHWRSNGAGHILLVPQTAHLRGPGPVQEHHPHYWKSPASSLFPENTEEEQIPPISAENLWSGRVGKVWHHLSMLACRQRPQNPENHLQWSPEW